MKKVKLLVVVLLAFCLLAGCGSANATVSDKNATLIQIGDKKITKGDLYKQMVNYDSGDYIVKKALKIIVNKEVETTAEMETEAKAQLDSYVEAYGDLNTVLEYLGYVSEEDLYEDVLDSVKSEILIDKYIDENSDKLYEKYNPLMVRMMYFSEDANGENFVEVAEKALAEIKNDTFENVAAKYVSKDYVELASEALYTNESELDEVVAGYLAGIQAPETSSILIDSENTGCYIVRVTNTNRSQMDEDFRASLNALDTFAQSVYGEFMRKYNFTIFDTTVFNLMKDNYADYLGLETPETAE